MPSVALEAAPVDPAAQAQLASLRRLGRVLDGAVTIPGVGVRVGLDALIGLVPVVGDWVGALFSTWIVVRAAGLGAAPATLLRMIGNLGVDLVVGAVPVLGDIFDLGFRANERNLALLERHLQAPGQRRRADLAVVLAVAGGALALVVAAAVGCVWLTARLVAAVAG